MKRSEFILACLRLDARAPLAFVPVVGLVVTFANTRLFRKILSSVDERWNPAQLELFRGFCVSIVGGCLNLVLVGFLLLKWFKP